MELSLEQKLKMPFPAKSIHWRVGATTKDKSKGIALAYIDARDAMKRLDDIVGIECWQNRYSHVADGLVICDIGINAEGNGWIWKSNGAGDTNVEAEKGKLSDAFKRAAVQWGIGRYLYYLPNEWVQLNNKKIVNPPKLPIWATPEGYKAILLAKRVNK